MQIQLIADSRNLLRILLDPETAQAPIGSAQAVTAIINVKWRGHAMMPPLIWPLPSDLDYHIAIPTLRIAAFLLRSGGHEPQQIAHAKPAGLRAQIIHHMT